MSVQELEVDAAELLLESAKDIVEKIVSHTSVFNPESEEELLKFDEKELVVGHVLGRGGFCVIREVNAIKIEGKSFSGKKSMSGFNSLRPRSSSIISDESSSGPEDSSKDFMANRCAKSKKAPYVLKKVSEKHRQENRLLYLKGTVDLAVETKFLAALDHPNIIGIHGTSSAGPFEREGYFLIMDRLHETLPKVLTDWMTLDRQTKGITGVFAGGKKKVNALLVDRLKVAFDIASALAYLHGRGIVYRDLKPDNLGFNSKGKCKLFDFGLAKQLHEDERTEDGLYLMTGLTGSIRYMSPECGRKEPYNEKHDVYAFSMLFWYFMALEPPFGFYTDDMFVDRVFVGRKRPTTFDAWPEGISSLVKQCWDHNISRRPTFLQVLSSLRSIVSSVDPETAKNMDPNGLQSQPLQTDVVDVSTSLRKKASSLRAA